MRKLTGLLAALLLTVLLNGCASTQSEYFEELTAVEETNLELGARKLALQGKAVPEHMLSLFMETKPSRRIVYEGNKSGKATFRWELYDMPKNPRRITQKDINPHWIVVYAIGNLRDPEWKLAFAQENNALQMVSPDQLMPEQPRSPAKTGRPARSRQKRRSY